MGPCLCAETTHNSKKDTYENAQENPEEAKDYTTAYTSVDNSIRSLFQVTISALTSGVSIIVMTPDVCKIIANSLTRDSPLVYIYVPTNGYYACSSPNIYSYYDFDLKEGSSKKGMLAS